MYKYIRNTCLLIFLFVFYSNKIIGQDYLIKYSIQSQLDSSNLEYKFEEIATLFIQNQMKSYFYSDNFAAKDSIMRLINSGKVTTYEIMSDKGNLKLTQFNQHITKDLSKNQIDFFEEIFFSVYSSSFQPNFRWEIKPDTLTIQGYRCNKATGYFGGRKYIAWFTHEIPISDGPYVFYGLPGLIVKIYDDKNQYDFSLLSFEQTKSTSFLKIPNVGKKVISATREQVFKARERMRTQFLEVLENEMGIKTIASPEMQQRYKQNQKADNNPIELRVD